jgi:hypothetical protein
MFPLKLVLHRCMPLLYIRATEPLELIAPKAIIPVPRMDYFRSPRWEALRSHQGTGRNHNCHGSPRCGARRFGPAECLASRHLQCDHRETHSPSRDLAFVSRNPPGFVRLQLLLCGSCSSNRLLVTHTRHTSYWNPKLLLNRPSPYVCDKPFTLPTRSGLNVRIQDTLCKKITGFTSNCSPRPLLNILRRPSMTLTSLFCMPVQVRQISCLLTGLGVTVKPFRCPCFGVPRISVHR